MATYAVSQPEVDSHFIRLERALKCCTLPTFSGLCRIVDADEFMLMYGDGLGIHFKHRDTRCYVMLTPEGCLSWRDGATFDKTHW